MLCYKTLHLGQKSDEIRPRCNVFMWLSLDLHDVVVWTETFKGCTVELFAVIRMSDADEELRTFLH